MRAAMVLHFSGRNSPYGIADGHGLPILGSGCRRFGASVCAGVSVGRCSLGEEHQQTVSPHCQALLHRVTLKRKSTCKIRVSAFFGINLEYEMEKPTTGWREPTRIGREHQAIQRYLGRESGRQQPQKADLQSLLKLHARQIPSHQAATHK